MPTYVYKCPVCGSKKEVQRPAADETIEVCEGYGHQKHSAYDMRKIPQTFGINWKEGKPT